MSTNTSQNLGLHLWEPTDQVLRTEFNQNWQKIDTAVNTAQQTADTAESKADAAQTTATAAQTAIAAVEEDLGALEAGIASTGSAASSALAQAKQELAAQIQSVQAAAAAAQATADAAWAADNLPFVFGSYVGQGDTRNTHTITVGFSPRVLIISCDDSSINLCLFPGQQAAYDCDITWGDTGVTLSGYEPEYRMDKQYANYYYWAWR